MNDIIGNKYNLLTVLKFYGRKLIRTNPKTRYRYFYECLCDCGNTMTTTRDNLLQQHTKSCGCLKRKCGNENKCWRGCGELSLRKWTDIKNKAFERNLIFNITINEAWDKFVKQDGKCALTGQKISFGKKAFSKHTASLDRIDNMRGYESDNIQWLHKDINWMKGTFTTERFVELCKLVAEGNYVT